MPQTRLAHRLHPASARLKLTLDSLHENPREVSLGRSVLLWVTGLLRESPRPLRGRQIRHATTAPWFLIARSSDTRGACLGYASPRRPHAHWRWVFLGVDAADGDLTPDVENPHCLPPLDQQGFSDDYNRRSQSCHLPRPSHPPGPSGTHCEPLPYASGVSNSVRHGFSGGSSHDGG